MAENKKQWDGRQNASKPRILITAGDPNGIGPEIVLKAIHNAETVRCCRPRVVGEPGVLASLAKALRLPFSLPSRPEGGKEDAIVPAGSPPRVPLVPGTVQAEAGRIAYESLLKAHRLLQAGKAEALVTAPWCKEALHAAGFSQTGHTETLAALSGSPDPTTLFVCGPLRIAFLTRHIPLSRAVAAVRRDRILSFLRRLHKDLGSIGLSAPRIAVAALNPHAGEGGLLGREEIDEIRPAVERAAAEGIDASGPFPADAVFHEAAGSAFDCVAALYHDQGHIAAKTRDFFGTVALTLGLPYLRTSPDHGTAFDIAGKGRADAGSLVRAVVLAAELAEATKAGRAGPAAEG